MSSGVRVCYNEQMEGWFPSAIWLHTRHTLTYRVGMENLVLCGCCNVSPKMCRSKLNKIPNLYEAHRPSHTLRTGRKKRQQWNIFALVLWRDLPSLKQSHGLHFACMLHGCKIYALKYMLPEEKTMQTGTMETGLPVPSSFLLGLIQFVKRRLSNCYHLGWNRSRLWHIKLQQKMEAGLLESIYNHFRHCSSRAEQEPSWLEKICHTQHHIFSPDNAPPHTHLQLCSEAEFSSLGGF